MNLGTPISMSLALALALALGVFELKFNLKRTLRERRTKVRPRCR